MSPSHRPTLVVVDDEEEIRQVVAFIAQRSLPESTVLTAPDAETAERTCLERDVCAVLTDLRMPGRSGIQLIQRLRARRPDIRCALMTGFIDESIDGVRLADLPVVEVLRKPFGLAECERVLTALVGTKATDAPTARRAGPVRPAPASGPGGTGGH